jgi:tetratricopeptide (TPR) repeat protein
MSHEEKPSFLDNINTQFENSFALCAIIAREMGSMEEALLAAKRVFSYNPNSRRMLDLFPQYITVIEQISRLVDIHGQRLTSESVGQDSWTVLGYCYLTLGDFPNAFAAYAHAMRVHPESEDPAFWYAIGVVYAHYNYNDHALNCHQKILQLDPNWIYIRDVQFRLGLLHRQLGNFDSALQLFEKVKRAPPNNLSPDDIQLQVGYTLQLAGKAEQARGIYRDLYQRFPQCLQIVIQYAWFLFLYAKGNEEINNVSRIVQQGLRDHPRDPTLMLIAARIAMKQDDMATAYQHYRFCISYCGDNPFFWCGLGVLYYKNDQTQDAVVAFQRALYLKGEMPEAWLNIGLIFEHQGDFQSAQKIYQTGQGKCPGRVEFAERLNGISSQSRAGYRNLTYALIDVDDMKFIQPTPEIFAKDYVAAVPELPPECFGLGKEGEAFRILSTFPKSYLLSDS